MKMTLGEFLILQKNFCEQKGKTFKSQELKTFYQNAAEGFWQKFLNLTPYESLSTVEVK